jgi:hypothetical protein
VGGAVLAGGMAYLAVGPLGGSGHFSCPRVIGGAAPPSPRADSYAGPGPHPAELHVLEPDEDGRYLRLEDDTALPPEWRPEEGERPRLVVCRYLAEVGPTVTECDYAPLGGGRASPVPLVDATYAFRVYAAHTGALVASFGLPGTEGECPSQIPESSTRLERTVAPDEMADRLRPVVEADV